jgi:hypothetical protein
MDFTKPTLIGAHINGNNEQLLLGRGYDHNFVIRKTGTSLELAGKIGLLSLIVAVAVSFFCLLPPHHRAMLEEKKIERSDLPPAVEKTVAEQSKGATVRGFSEEKENGETFYEAQLMVAGHSKDVQMDKDGTITEVEEFVAMDSLTPAVKDGLQAKAGEGKLVKVESLTKHGKLVAYEAQVITGGKKNEVQVGPDGKPLDHEE